MKAVILLVTVVALTQSAELYNAKYDNVDVEAVVTNPQTLKAFLNCFIDAGECSDASAHFKKNMVEAVQQACARCTEAQKHIMRRFIESLSETDPSGLKAYKAKYDPEGKYFGPLMAVVASA